MTIRQSPTVDCFDLASIIILPIAVFSFLNSILLFVRYLIFYLPKAVYAMFVNSGF